ELEAISRTNAAVWKACAPTPGHHLVAPDFSGVLGRPSPAWSSGCSAEPGEQVVVVDHDHVLADLVLMGRAAERPARRSLGDNARRGRVGHGDDEVRPPGARLVPA